MGADGYIEAICAAGEPPFAMPVSDLCTFLDTASEDDFVQVVAAPLFRLMGFRSVRVRGHDERLSEYGQDIRCMKLELPTRHSLYFVAQAKAGVIDASAKGLDRNISRILDELSMSLDNPVFDDDTNSDHLPDHAILVASGRITRQAQELIAKILPATKKRRIMLMDQDRITDRAVEVGLPKSSCEDVLSYSRLQLIEKFVDALLRFLPDAVLRVGEKAYSRDQLLSQVRDRTPMGREILRALTHFRWYP